MLLFSSVPRPPPTVARRCMRARVIGMLTYDAQVLGACPVYFQRIRRITRGSLYHKQRHKIC